MTKQKEKIRTLLRFLGIFAALGLSACVGGSGSEQPPSPPPPDISAGIGNMKWHPGHYIKFSARSTEENINSRLAEVADLPFVRGIVVPNFWKQLEPTENNYDFERIDKLLHIAAAQGKQFFLLIMIRNAGSNVVAPDYLRTDEYEGGVFQFPSQRGTIGESVLLWNEKVFQRMTLLIQALADRYDKNPFFEGVIFNETAFGQPLTPVSNEQRSQHFSNLIRVNSFARRAFANSIVIQYVNYPRQFVDPIFQNSLKQGVGFGAPDVYVGDDYHNQFVYSLNSKARGQIPIGMQVESDSFLHRCVRCSFDPPSIEELYVFARDQLYSNYIFWDQFQTRTYRSWDKLVAFFKSDGVPKTESGGLATECPKSYATCIDRSGE